MESGLRPGGVFRGLSRALSHAVPLTPMTATWETTLENGPLLVQVRLNDQ